MSAATVPALTEATFDEFVDGSDVPVLVDFWATWCGPCKMLAPVVDEVAARLAGRLVVAKVDVDDQPGLASRFQVMSMPTLLLLSEGTEAVRLVGARSATQLIRELEAAL
jgi:thioredoxin 1